MAVIDETFPDMYKACGTAVRTVAPYQCRPARVRRSYRGFVASRMTPAGLGPAQSRQHSRLPTRPLLQYAGTSFATSAFLRESLAAGHAQPMESEHGKWVQFSFEITSVSHDSILGPRFPSEGP